MASFAKNPRLPLVAERVNQRSQCRRRLPPAGMIEIVARESRAPFVQNSLEPPGPDVRRHLIRVDIRDALPRQCGLSNKIGVVEHQRALDANLEGPSLFLKVPGVQPTCPDVPVVDATMAGEL